MPRKTLTIEPTVEYLSVLDEHGQLDETVEPQLDGDFLVRMYRNMLATRRLDERLINLQRQGRIGTYGPSRGQEAAQTGTAMALRPDDWTAQSFREMGVTLYRGWPMHMPMFFWGGFERGNVPAGGINDLPIAVPVSSQILHGVGIAWAMKVRKQDTICITYCGDGGTSEGDFHEGMNFAGVFNLPVVFVVQNNQFAISHPRQRQTQSKTIAEKAIAYGFNAIQVDGNDVLSVHSATTEAVAKARSGGGPTLIECVTYRLSVHTTADDPTKYRCAEEVKKWEKRDPLIRFRKYLLGKGVLDEGAIEGIEEDIRDEIKTAIAFYEQNSKYDPLEQFEHLFAEISPELAAQRDELATALHAEGWGNL